jgi:hypothetical protein
MAPGFSLSGISGFISAAGAASGAAGGAALGTGAIAAIGGAAAGGAVLAVSKSGGEELPMETVVELGDVASEPLPPATPTTTTSSPPSPPTGDTKPVACFAMDPNPAVVVKGEPLRLDGSCSRADREGDRGDRIEQYVWDFSDGRQKTGRVVTIVFREAGNYEVTLTVTDGDTSVRARSNQDSLTRQIVVEERIEACFTVTDADFGTGCKIRVDASCSKGDIMSYEWVFSDGIGSYSYSGQTVVKDRMNCSVPFASRFAHGEKRERARHDHEIRRGAVSTRGRIQGLAPDGSHGASRSEVGKRDPRGTPRVERYPNRGAPLGGSEPLSPGGTGGCQPCHGAAHWCLVVERCPSTRVRFYVWSRCR